MTANITMLHIVKWKTENNHENTFVYVFDAKSLHCTCNCKLNNETGQMKSQFWRNFCNAKHLHQYIIIVISGVIGKHLVNHESLSSLINPFIWFEGFSTYEASITTPTPVGCTASVIATAICLVNLSCTGINNYTY